MIAEPNSTVYEVSVGWYHKSTRDDGRLGFGESGFENRVIAYVDESSVEHYIKKFTELYDDKVIVEIWESFYINAND